ncbi:MAG: TGS domain-containing protein, partial [Thermoplasmata archaeon]|nr:TGS domain-containing protein [Thermoplasmata archaeon]
GMVLDTLSVTVSSTVKLTHLGGGLAADIAREFGLHNGQLVFREDATADQLIDVLAGNRVYEHAILAVNKCELLSPAQREALAVRLLEFHPRFISAKERIALPDLVEAIGHALQFIRIYVKPPGEEPDMDEPVILRRGQKISDLLKRLPTELDAGFKASQVWGKSARFPGQTVGRDHPLADEDIVTIVVQRGVRAGS